MFLMKIKSDLIAFKFCKRAPCPEGRVRISPSSLNKVSLAVLNAIASELEF